jgi:hypothetical protein
MLAAIAGRPLLDACYASAVDHGYLWHEFGTSTYCCPDLAPGGGAAVIAGFPRLPSIE